MRASARLCSMLMFPTGKNFGTVLAQPLTGFLCEYGFDGGWPSVFYVFGEFTSLLSSASHVRLKVLFLHNAQNVVCLNSSL